MPVMTPKFNSKQLLKAYQKASRRLIKDPSMVASASSAGFVNDVDSKTTGYQVFVKVCRYDESLLQLDKLTGGLLENKQ